MHTIIQFYSPADVNDGERKEIIKHRNMHTIIQFYSRSEVDDRVDREGQKK